MIQKGTQDTQPTLQKIPTLTIDIINLQTTKMLKG